MRLELCVAVQSCVNKENRRGLSTQPWWVPVLVITVDEVRSPILTTCGLPVRQSKTHLHREVLSPRSTSFETSLMDCKSGSYSKGFETLGAFMSVLPCVRLLMYDDFSLLSSVLLLLEWIL